MAHRGMKFGIFLAPFHTAGENPTPALGRDMELIEWLDHLGYDEVWIGEHHSAGWELIASRNCPFLSVSVPPPQSAWANVGTTSSPAGAAW
jgi:limonene 1,2-monooxygenase